MTLSDSEVSAALREARDRGVALDDALGALRQAGASQIQSVKAVREVERVDLGEAKRIVDACPFWGDTRAANERLRDLATKVLIADANRTPLESDLVSCLTRVADLLALPGSDLGWGGNPHGTVEALRQEVLDHLEHISLGDGSDEVLEALDLLFLPTGALQETSMVSGWADEFIVLSTRYDVASRSEERRKKRPGNR